MKTNKILFLVLFLAIPATIFLLSFSLNACLPQFRSIYAYSHRFKIFDLISVLTPITIVGFLFGLRTNKFKENIPFAATTWGYFLLTSLVYWKYRWFLGTGTYDLLETVLLWVFSTVLYLLALFSGVKMNCLKKKN